MEAWLDEKNGPYIRMKYEKSIGMHWHVAKNMEDQKKEWMDVQIDSLWGWTDRNKVWMDGWIDEWMDGWWKPRCGQHSNQQSSRGLASSSSYLTSAGRQTLVKLLQRRKPDAVKDP